LNINFVAYRDQVNRELRSPKSHLHQQSLLDMISILNDLIIHNASVPDVPGTIVVDRHGNYMILSKEHPKVGMLLVNDLGEFMAKSGVLR